MFVFSCLQLISLSVLLISYSLGDADVRLNRNRRQTQNGIDANFRGQPSNSMDSSQSKASNSRSAGYYSSNLFKPPNLSGGKPTGWFDTKYPNWIQSRSGSIDQNDKVEGKNGSPESLMAGQSLPSRSDGGATFLNKVAQKYMSNGEKSFNFAPYGGDRYRGTVCTNINSFNGYTFGRFPCPLPMHTGMNQLDRFCCGSAEAQFCCNEQEYRYYQQIGSSGGRHRHPKNNMYQPSRNWLVMILVPIAGTIVGILAVVIVFMYYRKTKNSSSNFPTTRLNDKYEAVPQDSTVDRPLPPPRPNFNSHSNA